ncbi:hypothetical protein MNBD_GAMMA25-2309 [hydrothermal vent metagenome]|uniref:Peptidase M48 domain-containing protein n=1 Tax=hydrothermal vent metagenome TaxID=652676 RepID=A0A3B1APY8_9ZZZZ
MIAGVLLITLLISLSVDWLVRYIPFEYEQQLVQKYEPELKDRDEVDAYLQILADELAVAMELPAGMKITVHYVNDDTVNAFATLGGHIMVFRGLLEKLPSENALIMLLGHEMAHIKLRHPLRAMGKGMVLSVLFSMVLGQSSDAASQLMSNAGMMTMLGFSREQEEGADEEGMQAMWRYYHHVAGSLALFDVLQKVTQKQGAYVPALLRSHPQTADRITHLREIQKTRGWIAQGTRHLIPANILEKISTDKSMLIESK